MESNGRSSKPAGGKAPAKKKPYTSPALTLYGSVKKLTQMAKLRRVSDGAQKQT